ncbi:MAG: glycosyltransferase [Candidatus Bathyarchaeia archaeon]
MAKGVETFLRAGYEVSIASTFKFNRREFWRLYGVDLSKIKLYSFPFMMPKFFGMYYRLLSSFPLKRAIRKENPDVVFTDNESFKPIFELKRKGKFKLIEYIHFPFKLIQIMYSSKEKEIFPEDFRNAIEMYMRDAELYQKKYEKGFWKLYFSIWLKLYNKVTRENPFEIDDCVIVNSNYIANLVKLLWNQSPIVLYPPVKINDLIINSELEFDKRDNSIVMLGRITPEKRYETAIEAVAMSKSKPKLQIIGGLLTASFPYLEKLKRLSKEKNVNVEFHTNISRNQVVNLLTRSKIFVHACVGEHFGIAVVEGMAAGLPVIVHKSGGPYMDIIDYGRYGKYYETTEELTRYIDEFESDPRQWEIYHKHSLRRAIIFREEEFSRRLLKIIEKS